MTRKILSTEWLPRNHIICSFKKQKNNSSKEKHKIIPRPYGIGMILVILIPQTFYISQYKTQMTKVQRDQAVKHYLHLKGKTRTLTTSQRQLTEKHQNKSYKPIKLMVLLQHLNGSVLYIFLSPLMFSFPEIDHTPYVEK